jgi:hypothetical protein
VRLKESSSDLGSFYAYISNHEEFCHRFRLLHSNLLHGFDVVDPVTKDIDDLDVLDVWDSVPGIAETFHIVTEALIMLLLDGLQGLCSRWMLVRALKVLDEHHT